MTGVRADDTGGVSQRVHRGWLVAGAAAVTWGLMSAIRVWLPSVMHVHGDAGATPAAQLGLFALAWFLVPLAAVPAVRRVGPRPLWLAGVAVLAVARVALQLTDGGGAQLYLASITVVAAAVALVALVAGTPSGHLARVGVVLGLGAEAVQHAALGTVDLLWRDGGVALAAVVVLAVTAVSLALRASQVALWWPGPLDDDGEASAVWTRGAAWPWWSLGPAIVLMGVLGSAPARLELAASVGPREGVLALGLASALAVTAAALGPVLGALLSGWLGAALVVLTTVAAIRPEGRGSALGQLGLIVAIGLVLGAPGTTPGDSGPRRRAGVAAGSLLVFLAVGFGYYAAYELALPVANETFLVAAAGGLGVLAVLTSRDGRGLGPARGVRLRGTVTAASTLVVAGLVGALVVPTSPASPPPPLETDGVRVATYNVHMGYDVRGRFDVDGLATAIDRTGADVVVLNEVDRGWLLEGGHDLLRLLRERTGMTATFAPAADAVWGNAILSRLPLRDVRAVSLPRDGSAMRRSLISAVVEAPRGDLAVVGTHLHHIGDEPNVRLVQARAVAAEVARLSERQLPVALLGDLNAEVDAPELEPLGFLQDAAPGGQPTFRSDQPERRIDHVLVTSDLAVSDPWTGTSTASDHLPVAVTVHLPGSGDDGASGDGGG